MGYPDGKVPRFDELLGIVLVAPRQRRSPKPALASCSSRCYRPLRVRWDGRTTLPSP